MNSFQGILTRIAPVLSLSWSFSTILVMTFLICFSLQVNIFPIKDFERSKFTVRAFSLFDSDGSGELDFREFVISIWNYCSIDKTGLIEFAFALYDMDSR